MTNSTDNSQTVSYGSWPAAITSELLTQGVVKPSETQWDNGNLYWLESRPNEKGRTTLLRKTPNGEIIELTPYPIDVRSKVHEYGGGSFTVRNGHVVFVSGKDQALSQLHIDQPQHITTVIEQAHTRFADLTIDVDNQQVIAVAEYHHPSDDHRVDNSLVSVSLSDGTLSVLASGSDFYANPVFSPNGQHLAWISWSHPNMPWDNTELWYGNYQRDTVKAIHKVTGNGNEAICQAKWSPAGELFFISDRDNWWNIYRYNVANDQQEKVLDKAAEFATPPWVFGMSCYDFISHSQLLCCYSQMGIWHLATIDLEQSTLTPIKTDAILIESISADYPTGHASFIGASEKSLSQIQLWQQGQLSAIGSALPPFDAAHIATAEALNFKNTKGDDVYGFFYSPTHKKITGLTGEKPPLIVICHGGPTAATNSALNIKIQYWTNRGFAVFDINYTGSTGFGRDYRHRLFGQWGVQDVDDIVSGANYLIAANKVNPEQIIIRGSSAGGYTVLAALTQSTRFNAGASLYGIGDLNTLASDTHKFEARYLDNLIAPYHEPYLSVYHERSPINHSKKLTSPVIFLQGLQDKVVPPSQAEAMVSALSEQNIPVAYVTYPNEGHGFRDSHNIQHSLAVEYAFYADQFGFTPGEDLPSIPYITEDAN